MEDQKMGNQQGNDNFERGYLIGMLDGEGTVSLIRNGKTKTPPLFTKLQPYIAIAVTDKSIMDRTVISCQRLGLPHHIRVSERNIKHKPAIVLTVSGLGRVWKWIKELEEEEYGKKERMELLKEFIELRKPKKDTHPKNKPYSQREIQIYNEIRMLNERGGKSRHIFSPINMNESMEKNRQWKFDKMAELVNKGWSQEKIGKFFGIDQSSVNKWIKRNYQTLNDYHQDP